MKFERTFKTAGDGYWSDVSKEVKVTKLFLGYVNDENDFGELCVKFDTKSWDVDNDGLIYTDSLFLANLREHLDLVGLPGADVDYSEQGMQGDDYVSLDVGEDFLAAWEALETVL